MADVAKLMTRSVQSILDEWFESEALRVALATDGVIGTNGGPRTPGTAYVLLHHVMGGVGGVRGLWGFVEGGMGAITQALAASAQAHGAVIKTDAPVAKVLTRNDAATGVVLADGTEYQARVVISNADPKRTFLHLVERSDLPDEFVAQIESYQCEGSSFKLNLALGELPDYTAFPRHNTRPAAWGHNPHLPQHGVLGTCLGRCQVWEAFHTSAAGDHDSDGL